MSEEKLLAEYDSPSARDLPAQFKGKTWAGVGTRGRVLLSSTVSKNPVFPFNDQLFNRQIGISNPQFGTASDWATALSLRSGEPRARTWLEGEAFFFALKRGGARVLPGNGDVARSVADGVLRYGWSDSDDFLAQKREKKTIYVARTSSGNVLIPGAVSILHNAPNPENAKKLFDAIVSAQNEANLTKQMPGVFSLRRLKGKSNFQSGGVDFSFLMNAPRDDYAKWPATWRKIREPLNQIFASK
jgi:ABC-type Fe3+ transport system substrate-binding protein